MLTMRLCDILGVAVAIILPPRGGSAKSAEFAAAVANLGGLGVTERLGSAPETALSAPGSLRRPAPAPRPSA